MCVCVFVCVCVCRSTSGLAGLLLAHRFQLPGLGVLGLRVERVEGLEGWGLRFEKVSGRLRVKV